MVGTAVTVCKSLPMRAGEPDELKEIRSGKRIGDLSGVNQRIDALLAAQEKAFAKRRK